MDVGSIAAVLVPFGVWLGLVGVGRVRAVNRLRRPGLAPTSSFVNNNAEERSERLLLGLLNAAEQAEWRNCRCITLHGVARSYRVLVDRTGQVVVMWPRGGGPTWWPCTRADRRVPVADQVAAYVLLIRADLDRVLTYEGHGRTIKAGVYKWR